jgi:hypothetical protein
MAKKKKDKQRSTKHTHKTKDRVTRTSQNRVSTITWFVVIEYMCTNDHGYFLLVINTSWSFPHSWLIIGFITMLTRRVPQWEHWNNLFCQFRVVGQGMEQTYLYLWYPLFQAQWNRCDQWNHQTYVVSSVCFCYLFHSDNKDSTEPMVPLAYIEVITSNVLRFPPLLGLSL